MSSPFRVTAKVRSSYLPSRCACHYVVATLGQTGFGGGQGAGAADQLLEVGDEVGPYPRVTLGLLRVVTHHNRYDVAMSRHSHARRNSRLSPQPRGLRTEPWVARPTCSGDDR